eukprot:CAMPEP_0198128916 /NCGR_PEP_ID=MMETSP1442-20131203/50461_1 /TAXON_ID= /ORGANISM="Craspedostauros australis, Strain CCMP3328" /LENGTH=448 /DNA_ID=CAMNT_0043789173 /DNA_START=70 /DNA_END=1416 /DNA_ORIENTATION=-
MSHHPNSRNGQRLTLEAEEDWLRRNGLRSHAHQPPPSDKVDAEKRAQQQSDYAKDRWEEYFEETDRETKRSEAMKKTILRSWQGKVVGIEVEDGVNGGANSGAEADEGMMKTAIKVLDYPLPNLAASSDTIFVLGRSGHMYGSKGEAKDDADGDSEFDIRAPSSSSASDLKLSLVEYDPDTVQRFLDYLCANYNAGAGEASHDINNDNTDDGHCDHHYKHGYATDSTEEEDGEDHFDDDYKTKRSIKVSLPFTYWAEACRIAHYLQCAEEVQQLVALLEQNITTSNCLYLIQLADQLSLHTLFEAALQFMLTQVGNLESSEWWSQIESSDLKESLQTMTSLLQTSLLHRGGKRRTNLFFSTLDEYLAIFAEQVEYYQERLEDARRSQSMLKHRMENRGRHGHTTDAWQYAQDKIVRQETRVQTLKQALKDQKRLFGRQKLQQHAKLCM